MNIYNKNNPIFQVDSDIVKEAYNNLDNYLIIESPTNNSSEKLCVIYFSGNSIYYPNDKNTFAEEILNKNRFEWYGIRIPEGNKHIFLRDIHKQWYLTGINAKISSPEKLIEFLKKETSGYRIICIGSSAGGYAAILYGSLLHADIVYSFSPQVELISSLHLSSEEIDPLIFRLQDTNLKKYYDITDIIKQSSSKIVICSPIKSKWDIREFKYLDTNALTSKSNLHIIKFNTSKHGVPFPKIALKKFLTSQFLCKEYYKKTNNPIMFSIRQVGVWKTLTGSYKQIITHFLSKIKKY